MSGDSLDDQGQSKGLQIIGIGSEWERCEALRAHLRGEGAVIFEKDKSENVKNTCSPWIHGYLQPLLLRMAETDQKLQPLVDPLRDEISGLYQMFSKQIEPAQIVHDSWMTRKYLGLVKMKARKVSRHLYMFCQSSTGHIANWFAKRNHFHIRLQVV